jgi:hypothetical protein
MMGSRDDTRRPVRSSCLSILQAPAIVGLAVAAAIIYGILHDQITAHVCVQYFTIGHPLVFHTDSPTLLGLGWGIIATWWVGLFLGVPLAVVARAGRRPKRSVASLLWPVTVVLLVMAACALLAGIVGYLLASMGLVFLLEPLSTAIPPDKHAAFLADVWAHSASYLVGLLGGIVLLIRVWRSRCL